MSRGNQRAGVRDSFLLKKYDKKVYSNDKLNTL